MERNYYDDPTRLSLVRRFGWGRALLCAGVLAVLGVYGYVQAVAPSTRVAADIPVFEQPAKPLMAQQTAQPVQPVQPPPPPDTRIDDLLRLMRQQELRDAQIHAQLQKELDALKQQKPSTGQTEKPKVLKHQPMMYKQFAQPETTKATEPLYTLAPGTFLPCQVVTAVNSETGSTFVAETTVPVYASPRKNHQKLLVPQGSKIMGAYDGGSLVHGSDRLPTVALSLVIDGGQPLDLGQAPITDGIGQNGLVTRIDQHWWRLAKAVLIGGALRGGAQAVQVATAGGGPAAQVSAGIAQSGSQAATSKTNWAIDVRPTIWADPGAQCTVIVTQALELPARDF